MTLGRRAASAALALSLTSVLVLATASGASVGSVTSASALTASALAAPAVTADGVFASGGAGSPQNHLVTIARGLLDQRADALRDDDRQAWMATVSEHADAGYRRRQAVVFDQLRRLPVAGYRTDSVELVRGADRGNRFVVKVDVSYRLTGFGGQRHATSYLTVGGDPVEAGAVVGSGVDVPRFLSDSDGPTELQMWDLPGMQVERGRSSLVIGNVSPSRLRAYARMADHAVRTVNRVWGRDWGRTAVLVVPARDAELSGLLGGAPGAAAEGQVSAVTTGPVDPAGRSRAAQVVIAPHTWDRLVPAGRQVVLTHELTHVATGWSTRSPLPLWLSEGMAEYVAYTEVDLPRREVAASLLDRVRSGSGPTALPSDVEFDPATHDLAVSDNAAYLLCTVLADARGRDGLVALYRAVADGSLTLGGITEQLLRAWLAELQRLSSPT